MNPSYKLKLIEIGSLKHYFGYFVSNNVQCFLILN
jgi:hypothetical protein